MKKILLCIIAVMHLVNLSGQLLVINGPLIISHDTLFVHGTIRVSPLGYYQNNSGVCLNTDSIVNNGIFISLGTQITSGSSHQTISGNFFGINYLGRLIKNNQGILAVSQNARAQSLDVKTDGNIAIADNQTLLIDNTFVNSITGCTSARYISLGSSSTLKRFVSDTSLNSSYLFPIGNTVTGYAPLSIKLNSLGSTGPNSITAALHLDSVSSVSFSKPLPLCSLSQSQYLHVNCIEKFHWLLTGPSDYKYSLETSKVPLCGLSPHRIITTTPGNNNWNTTIENTAGVVVEDLCNFTQWDDNQSFVSGGTYQGLTVCATIASNIGTLLPVTLVSFTAHPINNQSIQLNWITASELNNDKFLVTRSDNGYSFEPIGEILGNGTSTQTHSYTYLDTNVLINQTYYYQLIQTDYDSHTEKSIIVSAQIAGTTIPITVTITNLIGQIVTEYEIPYYADPFQNLRVPHQSTLYVVTGTQGTIRSTRRVFIP
ncbi:MAG: hypothetical protein WCG20_03190 [bacterium]